MLIIESLILLPISDTITLFHPYARLMGPCVLRSLQFVR